MSGPAHEATWVLILAGAFFALDHAAWPSLLLAQPLVAGGLTGLLLGHPEAGLVSGAVTQMIWMALAPVGGVAIPEAWLAAIATALAAPTDLGLASHAWLDDPRLAAPAVVGVGAAHLGRWTLIAQRQLQRRWAARNDTRLAAGDASRVEKLHRLGLLAHAGRGALLTLAVVLGAPPLARALAGIGVAAPAGRLALALCALALAGSAPRARLGTMLACGVAAGALLGVLR